MGRGNVLLKAENFQAVSEEEVTQETKEKSQTEDGIYVKGMALPFGKTSRNGVQYEEQSVRDNHEDLQGRSMLFNHKQDWVSGHILNTEITEDGMFFEGDINPNAEMPNGVPVAEAIQRGDISSVSIQAFIEQTGEEADEEAIVDDMQTEKVKVRDFLEISAVSIPGFPQAEALPEHLQKQGVKPVTEAVGVNPSSRTEQADYQYETGDWVSWEFGSGSSQGQVTDRENEPGESLSAQGNEREATEEEPVYKMDEWDEEEEELTNDVVKSESELSEIDDPREETSEEQINSEAFEFRPVPAHVLYDNREDAMQRARNLGLEDVHEHEMGDQIFYMAGDNHDEWMQAVNKDDATEESSEDKRAEPFAGYDDFDDCVEQNRDKADPEAYCSVIKRKSEESKNLSEAIEDVDTTPTDEMADTASQVLEKIDDPELDNDGCATRTGLERANQLENKEELSADTVGRMVSFFARHDGNQEVDDDVDSKWEDCGYVSWQLWGGDAGRDWAERKQEELEEAKEESLNNISEDDNMTEQEKEGQDGTEQEELDVKSERFEQVGASDLYEMIAGMHPQVEASDLEELLGEFDYDFNVNALVDFVAKVVDEETNTVMDNLADMAEGEMPDEDEPEEEGDYSDDDEDDVEEETSEEESEEVEDKEREDLEEQYKEQQEKIEKLEKQLETIIDEDEASSKQESPSAEASESDLNRRPSFKGLLNK